LEVLPGVVVVVVVVVAVDVVPVVVVVVAEVVVVVVVVNEALVGSVEGGEVGCLVVGVGLFEGLVGGLSDGDGALVGLLDGDAVGLDVVLEQDVVNSSTINGMSHVLPKVLVASVSLASL
jgi:hypothetical protein